MSRTVKVCVHFVCWDLISKNKLWFLTGVKVLFFILEPLFLIFIIIRPFLPPKRSVSQKKVFSQNEYISQNLVQMRDQSWKQWTLDKRPENSWFRSVLAKYRIKECVVCAMVLCVNFEISYLQPWRCFPIKKQVCSVGAAFVLCSLCFVFYTLGVSIGWIALVFWVVLLYFVCVCVCVFLFIKTYLRGTAANAKAVLSSWWMFAE